MFPAFELYQPPGIGAEHRTELTITERNLKKGLVDMDPNALDYVKRENYRIKVDNVNDMFLKYKLDDLIGKWEAATSFYSSIDKIVADDNFKSIVAFGEKIIPSILIKIQQHPGHLVWALNFITNRTISDRPISVSEACKKWVAWGINHHLI